MTHSPSNPRTNIDPVASQGDENQHLTEPVEVALLPGDGIGPAVVQAAVRVLEAAGFAGTFREAEIGWKPWTTTGQALPEKTVQLVKDCGLALAGAVTTKPEREALAALPPDLARKVTSYDSPILALRRRLDLEISIRPAKTLWPAQTGPDCHSPSYDVTVVMQNTEGHYAGLEWNVIQGPLARALFGHPALETNPTLAGALSRSEPAVLSARIVTEGACRRVSRAAFRQAARHGYPRVILCDKWGVMQETASLFLDVARQEAAHWPQVDFSWMNADAFLARLTQGKIDRTVILTGALIGDLISDALAGLTGGIALAPCANIGPQAALFEPLHGSAPKYADMVPPVVNPTGAILAAAMLAEHAGQMGPARAITAAVAKVLEEGVVRTFDLKGLPGGPNVLDQGAASTEEFTDAVIDALP